MCHAERNLVKLHAELFASCSFGIFEPSNVNVLSMVDNAFFICHFILYIVTYLVHCNRIIYLFIFFFLFLTQGTHFVLEQAAKAFRTIRASLPRPVPPDVFTLQNSVPHAVPYQGHPIRG